MAELPKKLTTTGCYDKNVWAEIKRRYNEYEELKAKADAHNDLLAACKRAQKYLNKMADTGEIYADGISTLADCEQAIAKAEKQG